MLESANLELAVWELAAASRYGWRETKLRLALRLALLLPGQQDDEELFHVDNIHVKDGSLEEVKFKAP